MRGNVDFVMMKKIFDLDHCAEDLNPRRRNQTQCQKIVAVTNNFVDAKKTKQLRKDLRAQIRNQIEIEGKNGKMPMTKENIEYIFNKMRDKYTL